MDNFLIPPALQGLEGMLVTVSLVSLTIILAEIAVDLLFHQKRDYKETFANIGIGAVYDFFISKFATVVVISGLSGLANLSPFKLSINVWTMLLAILIADFIYYWNHRAEHRIWFFWAYHSVHHSSTDFNLTVALRLAWVEDFILWIFYIPMLFMGFHPVQVLIAIEIVGLYQIWIHNRKIGKLPILDSIFNTAANHRVHHGVNLIYFNKNYGGILIIWDRLFGTYQAESEKAIYGIPENIETHNPIKINFIEYFRIAPHLRHSKSLKEAVSIIFGLRRRQPQQIQRSDNERSAIERSAIERTEV